MHLFPVIKLLSFAGLGLFLPGFARKNAFEDREAKAKEGGHDGT